MDITYYSQQQCSGHVINSNHTSIDDGCGNKLININNTIFNRLFPDFGDSNETYFEISECGGGWPPQWLIDLVIAGFVVLGCCFLCCAVGCCWYCSFRKKRKKKVQNALINQPVSGYQTADGITTTA